MSDDVERVISGPQIGRRTFLRRLAVGSAFAVPVVSSFSMAGIQAVSAQAGIVNYNQPGGGIYTPNQTGYPGYASPGNVPITNSNQHGVLGFLEDIFSIHRHGL